MQKISSYLYPNRVQLLADLAGFTVEYTNVYQRNVKIYNGIDNTIEFDIKNADQKRIDLTALSNIELTIMDAAGNELPASPYDVTPTAVKGIAIVTIPQEDLVDLSHQFLTYSVTAVKDGRDVILYGDTRFGATGKMELIGNARPTFRDPVTYKKFTGEIDLNGLVVGKSPAIPTKHYEAVAATTIDIDVGITGFVGKVYVQATTDSTISVDSFKYATKIREYTFSSATTTTIQIHDLDIGDFNYFRVLWENCDITRVTLDNPTGSAGTVDIITAV